jgi:isopentenyldiphosphate isomerase
LVWVVIFNSNWKIALQKRSSTCSFLPHYWALSAWWHVSSWEDYLTSAKRELFEEIWVKCNLIFKYKEYEDRVIINWNLNNSTKSHFYFQAIFEWKYDWDFTFDDWEVEEVQFFSLDELKNMIKNKEKVMPWTIDVLEKYYLK